MLRFRVKGFLAWWVWRTYYLTQMPRFERKLRIVLDWTIALFFKYDIVKLDFTCDARTGNPPPSRSIPPSQAARANQQATAVTPSPLNAAPTAASSERAR